MGSNVKGFNNLRHQLDELKRKADAASGSVPIEDLLSPAFMSRHTHFSSFQEMLDASGAELDVQQDLDSLFGSEEWNAFVVSNTLFSGWEAMLSMAANEYMMERLGLAK